MGVERLELSGDEARRLMLAAQGLLDSPVRPAGLDDVYTTIDRLGVLQIDTINVIERTQYLVLWSRLGPYDRDLLDRLLYPERRVFEYWAHAASIIPMDEYRYYRPKMLRYAEHMWSGDRAWMEENEATVRRTLDHVRERGPVASADFERQPEARRTAPWTWYGSKDSRRALEILWTTGELMVHSRRAGQKVYDPRERILAEAFGAGVPRDDELPTEEARLRHFVGRTVRALGVIAPSWLWDYFRLALPADGPRNRNAAALAQLSALQAEGIVAPATIDGLREPAFVDAALLPVLARLRAGEEPRRTTLLSPFDSLIWDRQRARQLFGYEVCFEAYVPPAKRRFGYYCLAILHRGQLVGRLDAKMVRSVGRLQVHAVYLEAGVEAGAALVEGVAGALRELAAFLGADAVAVDRSDPPELATALRERLDDSVGAWP